ncbi:MAG TPA: 2-oxo acid dehydrogenase subunit E2 [Streptosporangiaceae bacterium]|nr:2-oxo acid dehydrogenase subunit E2 [Streptosporangiaceae bacterium]
MSDNERVVENLNRALHDLFEHDERMYILGQDLADPYGGAFGVTKGLSTRYPGRVISTPISETAMVGAANGLALCGNRVIVELMFADFAALAFDQLINFAAKTVDIYGKRRPMAVLLRCPVGGNRGYGPTHSQSLQKHFIGVPNLSLYELSPFHDAKRLLDKIFQESQPAILFEPKVVYSQRIFSAGNFNGILEYERRDGGWAHISSERGPGRVVALLVPGGLADRAIAAARSLALEDGVQPHVLIPEQIYPLDLRPIADVLAGAMVIGVAEESTPGGTWGTEVAARIQAILPEPPEHPILLINSRDSVIPAAPHLERQVLVQAGTITAAVRSILGQPSPTMARNKPAVTTAGSASFTSVTIPKLNNNDASYVLLTWLASDGDEVAEGSPIAEVETSKATQELTAQAAGILRVSVPAGANCEPGDVIARLEHAPAERPGSRGGTGQITGKARDATGSQMEPLALSRGQTHVSDIVSMSHRDIPAAFVAVKANVDAFLRVRSALVQAAGGAIGLLEVLVMRVAMLRPRFPACFGTLSGTSTARVAHGAHVAITLDAGNGLYLPVIRSAELRSAADIADQLATMRMQALRGTFTVADLAGANIALSWNNEPDVVLVQPLIPPGLACVISASGTSREVSLTQSGRPTEHNVINLGLAHDHRLVNGREAVSFLRDLAAILNDEQALTSLVSDNPLNGIASKSTR